MLNTIENCLRKPLEKNKKVKKRKKQRKQKCVPLFHLQGFSNYLNKPKTKSINLNQSKSIFIYKNDTVCKVKYQDQT